MLTTGWLLRHEAHLALGGKADHLAQKVGVLYHERTTPVMSSVIAPSRRRS